MWSGGQLVSDSAGEASAKMEIPFYTHVSNSGGRGVNERDFFFMLKGTLEVMTNGGWKAMTAGS
jgi:hypothetical protein